VVRAAAIERLARLEREHGVRSVAFEMLGPPRLTKMLYEAQVLGELAGSVGYLARSDPADLARRAAQAIARDADLRSTILSIGLPIIVQGDLVYRGATVLHPPEDGDASRAIAAAWVDLREPNCATWIARAGRIVEQAQQRQQTRGTSSGEEWDAMVPEDPVSPARMAAWVFRYEEGGERIKR